MKEWVDAITHQRILILSVPPRDSWQAEIEVLNNFLAFNFENSYEDIGRTQLQIKHGSCSLRSSQLQCDTITTDRNNYWLAYIVCLSCLAGDIQDQTF